MESGAVRNPLSGRGNFSDYLIAQLPFLSYYYYWHGEMIRQKLKFGFPSGAINFHLYHCLIILKRAKAINEREKMINS
jgi:hypothetical protein